MATDGDAHPAEDEMLPDEQEILPERGQRLDELDEEGLLTTGEVAENLGFDQD